MPKRLNPMAVSKVLTYTVEEGAAALGVTPATIRNYVKRGLPIMTAQRPFLISGEALRAFLHNQRVSRKRPLQKNELYCPSCKIGRRPYGMMVDLVVQSGKSMRLAGLCEVCERPCHRIVGPRQIKNFATIFDIAERDSGTA